MIDVNNATSCIKYMGDFRLAISSTVRKEYYIPEGKVKDVVNELVTCIGT